MITLKKTVLIISLILLGFITTFFIFFKAPKVQPTVNALSQPVFSAEPSSQSISSVASSEEPVIGFNANERGIPILLYHHFMSAEKKAATKSGGIVVSTEEFDIHMKALKDNGFTALRADEVVDYIKNGKKIPPKSVFITFDDGYKAEVYIAAPILRKYNFTGMVFMMTNTLLGKDEGFKDGVLFQYINQKDVDISKDVFEYASHTHTLHFDLTKQAKETLTDDLNTSKKFLATNFFAYPLGKYNDSVVNIVKNCGYSAAFTTVGRHAKKGDNLMLIPRYTILANTSTEKLMNKIEGIKDNDE